MIRKETNIHSTRRFLWHSLLLVALSAGLAGISGCVYLRLLALKNQLAQFDQFFQVEVDDSFILIFLEPKLYSKDILTLTKMPPSEKNSLPAQEEEWTFLFKKMVSETEIDPNPDRDISFIFRFNSQNLLASLTFSPLLLRMAPPEFLELSLRSLGNAKVDKKKRRVYGDSKNLAKIEHPLPQFDDVLKYLGNPYSEEIVDGYNLVTYRFRLETSHYDADREDRRLSIVQLYFDPETNKLMRFYGRFIGMKISINYRKLIENQFASTEK
ncbi:MAG: hypothetical protein JXR73_15940 [Candidatus Omnitrophica bacterium]|nr:hypothetical protein [Candidatus Omnitrophota bacterium]